MAQKFLNGIDISGNIVVDSHSAVGATVLDVQGTQGQLFSLTNSVSGDLFSVSDISGIPILNVNSIGLVTVDGTMSIGLNGVAPAFTLDVGGDIGTDRYIRHNGDVNTYFGFSGDDTIQFNTNSAERLRINSSGEAHFTGNITINKGTTGNPTINLIENSGGTQNAIIQFDQSSQNQLYITTSYESPTDTNRILLQPGGYSALIAYGGTSGVGSTKVEITNDLQISGDLTIGSDLTTTIGKAYLKTPNVTAVSYQRINADETLSLLTASQMLSALGGATTGSVPSDFVSAANGGTFAGNLNVFPNASTGTFRVGRYAGQEFKLHATDLINTLTSINDADENQTHDFILDREHAGSGANNFKIQKDGTDQLSIDTNANAIIAGDLTVSGGDITSNGVSIISNSTTATTLLIGDVTLGDTIQEMRIQVYGSDLLNLQDNEISLKSDAVYVTGSLSTGTAPATYLGLISSTGLLAKRTPAQVLSDIGAAPATGGSYLLNTTDTLTGDLTVTGDIQAGDSATDKVVVVGNLGIGPASYPKIVYPGTNAQWGVANNSTTGQVVIDLPGTLNNYDMMYMEIDIYEYNSTNATKLIVGGHNWNSGGNSNTNTTMWHNAGVTVIGSNTKSVYLGWRNDGTSNRRVIAIGETTSTWNYPSIHVAKVSGTEGYANSIDWVGDWGINLTTSGSYFTKSPTTDFNASSATTLKTHGKISASNFSGSSSNSNTGDQDLSSYVTNLTGHVTSVGNAAVLGSFTTAQLNTAISDGSIPSGNAVIDWTQSGAGTIHTDNYIENVVYSDFVSAANGGTFSGDIGVQNITMPKAKIFGHGSYFELSYGASNTSQFTFNADYDGIETATYTPHYSGTASAGMSIVKMPSGGIGGLQFFVKKHGTTSGSHNISTFNKILDLHQDGVATFSGEVEAASLDISGDVEIAGSLTVTGDLNITGDINSVSVTNLDVDDLTITLAKGAADSAAADGAGIIVDGAGASILYDHTGTQWEVNKPFEVKVGSSAIAMTEYSNGATIWLDGANGDFIGGDYYNIAAFGGGSGSKLSFGYSAAEKMYMDMAGNLYTAGVIDVAGTGTSTFGGPVTSNGVTLTGDQDLSGYYTETEANAKFLTKDGSAKEWVFEVNDEGSISGNKWYKIATVNQGNGGLHIRGLFSSHVETFGSQKVDIGMVGREGGTNDHLEITGQVDVLHNASGAAATDKCGIRIVESDITTSASYHYFDVYVRTTRYQMLRLYLTKSGNTTFHLTAGSNAVTTEPAPVAGGSTGVELDTSLLSEGNYVIDDSTPRRIYHEGHKPLFSEIESTPTTLAGYGITDAASSSIVNQSDFVSAANGGTFAANISSQGYTIDGAGLQTFQDFQSKPIDTDSGLFTVGGNGMTLGYSRAVSLWSTMDGVYKSWVGTNLRWDGTNYLRASNHQNNNWGNIAGILFTGNAAATGEAMSFVIDPPENVNGSGETTIGTTLPGGYTALSLHNDLSAVFSGLVSVNNKFKIATNGTATWGAANDYGQLSWDTGYALIRGQSNRGIKLQTNSSTTALTLDTSQNATFAGTIASKHEKYCEASISNSYVKIYRAEGEDNQIGGIVRISATSHGGSHVATFTALVSVNHSQDIMIRSDSCAYTQVTLKVESDNNEDYHLSVKSTSANAATYKFKIQVLTPKLTITTLPTTTPSTSSTLEHVTNFGSNVTGTGGTLQHKFGAEINASNFSGSHSGTSTNINTGDQTNITGNAATATNVAYSGLTGTVPTWNQDTTGVAGSANEVAYDDITGRPYIEASTITSSTSTDNVHGVAHATYTAAFFDFVIKNGTNVRAGTVYACHNGASTPLVEFTETSTVDLGDTSDVTLAVVITNNNLTLQATSTSNSWTIKTLIRAI